MLLNMPSKVFCRVILECIKIMLDEKLREEQVGKRVGQPCTDQIATMQIIVEQSIKGQSSWYINFIDFEKAFDSTSREVLWKLSRHYGMPDNVVPSSAELSIKVFLHRWYTMDRGPNH